MISLNRLARCIGLDGEISLVRDFFGYPTGIPPVVRHPPSISYATQVRRLGGPHLHLNLVLVGPTARRPENLRMVDQAVLIMREYLASAPLGLGRVLRFTTRGGDDGFGEAVSTRDRQAVPNDGLDCFVAIDPGFQSRIGIRTRALVDVRRDGPCDKQVKGAGIAIGVERVVRSETGDAAEHQVQGAASLALMFDYVIARYLGLEDRSGPDPGQGRRNAMHQPYLGRSFDREQGRIMAGHCLVRAGCDARTG